MLTGVARFKGDVLFDVQHPLEPGVKTSDAITAMKAKLMAGISAYIAAHNLKNDDVDVMEEDVGQEESEAAAKGQKKGQKRKHP